MKTPKIASSFLAPLLFWAAVFPSPSETYVAESLSMEIEKVIPFRNGLLDVESDGLEYIDLGSGNSERLFDGEVSGVQVMDDAAYFFSVRLVFGTDGVDESVYELWVASGLDLDCQKLYAFQIDEFPAFLDVVPQSSVLYFTIASGFRPEEIWTLTGSDQQPRKVADLPPNGQVHFDTQFNGALMWRWFVTGSNQSFWAVHGANDVEALGDWALRGCFDCEITVNANHAVLFVKELLDGSVELWRTDGTQIGTFMLSRPWEAPPDLHIYVYRMRVTEGWAVLETSLRTRSSTVVLEKKFWVSDGSVAGTRQVFFPDIRNISLIAPMDRSTIFAVYGVPGVVGAQLRMYNSDSSGFVNVFGRGFLENRFGDVFPIAGDISSVVKNGVVTFWLNDEALIPQTNGDPESYVGLFRADSGANSAISLTPELPAFFWPNKLNSTYGGFIAQESQSGEKFFLKQIEGDSEFRRSTAHASDTDANYIVSLDELMRAIQFYNSGAYHCSDEAFHTEDGYSPGGAMIGNCPFHDADNGPQDWRIDLAELLRIIQFYNSTGYHYCAEESTDETYCPGPI